MIKTVLTAAAAALLLSGAAMAQTRAPDPAASLAALGVSEAEVAAMRAVAPSVRQVTQRSQGEINNAPDLDRRGEAQRALFAQLEEIVKAQGLTVERYNQIATLAASNPDLARAIGPT